MARLITRSVFAC